jgi:hypothetical protein
MEEKWLGMPVDKRVLKLGTSIDPAVKHGKPFQPARPREGGDPFLFSVSEAKIGLPPSRERGKFNIFSCRINKNL